MDKLGTVIGIVALTSIILSWVTDYILFDLLTSPFLAILFTFMALDSKKNGRKGFMWLYSVLAVLGYVITFVEWTAYFS